MWGLSFVLVSEGWISDFWTILGASGVMWCKTPLGFIVERSGNFSNMIFVLQIAGCLKSMRSRQFGYIPYWNVCKKPVTDGVDGVALFFHPHVWSSSPLMLRSRLCRNSWTLLSFRQRSVWHFFVFGLKEDDRILEAFSPKFLQKYTPVGPPLLYLVWGSGTITCDIKPTEMRIGPWVLLPLIWSKKKHRCWIRIVP